VGSREFFKSAVLWGLRAFLVRIDGTYGEQIHPRD